MSSRSALLSRYLDQRGSPSGDEGGDNDYKSSRKRSSTKAAKKNHKQKKKKKKSKKSRNAIGQNLSIKDEDDAMYVKPNAEADAIDEDEDAPVLVELETPIPKRPTRHDSDDENDRNRHDSRRSMRHDSSDEEPALSGNRRARLDSDSDSDMSVQRGKSPRAQRAALPASGSKSDSESDSDSDMSVPRSANPARPRTNRNAQSSSDSDLSVSREPSAQPLPNQQALTQNSSKSSSSSSKSKSDRGGLMNKEEYARELAREKAASKIKSDAAGSEKASLDLGKNAATVYRDSRGRKLGMLTEFMRTQEVVEGKAVAESKLKYEWGTGKVDRDRLRDRDAYLAKMKEESFAQYADSKDLNDEMKSRVRQGDPMAGLIRKEKGRSDGQGGNERDGAREGGEFGKPKYSGPPAPPNRFGILPGYRWDGIHRGNGHERKLLMKANSNKAAAEDRYKWSVSGM